MLLGLRNRGTCETREVTRLALKVEEEDSGCHESAVVEGSSSSTVGLGLSALGRWLLEVERRESHYELCFE